MNESYLREFKSVWGRSNFDPNLKHTASPTVTMSTMLSPFEDHYSFEHLARPKEIPK